MNIDEMIEHLTVSLDILRNSQRFVGSFTFSSPALPLLEALADIALKLSHILREDFTVFEDRNESVIFSEEEQDSLGNPLSLRFKPKVRILGPMPLMSFFMKDIAKTFILFKQFLAHDFHDHGEFARTFSHHFESWKNVQRQMRIDLNELNQKDKARKERNQRNAKRRNRFNRRR